MRLVTLSGNAGKESLQNKLSVYKNGFGCPIELTESIHDLRGEKDEILNGWGVGVSPKKAPPQKLFDL